MTKRATARTLSDRRASRRYTSDLRIAMFGDVPATPPRVEQLLREHGFVDVRIMPPAAALSALAVGRRPLPPR